MQTRRTLCFSLLLTLLPPLEAAQARRAERKPNPIAPDRANLSYGPHKNNVLDLWLAKSATPTPLIVFIHGGGFVGGDKGTANPAFVRRALASGASYAAINYRFRGDAPIQDILRDCARAIQYLRSLAKEFNIDKSRVAAMGGSAGAGTSLWLAFHDDLADQANPDPVLRESSRISAAAATATQATYDILRWKEFLGDAAAQAGGAVDGAAFYGLKTMDELTSEKGRRIRADVDMLGLVTKDDPPVLLISSSQHDAMQTKGAVVHSARHAAAVKKRCDEVGASATLKIVAGLNDAQSGVNPLEFLLRHLGVQPK